MGIKRTELIRQIDLWPSKYFFSEQNWTKKAKIQKTKFSFVFLAKSFVFFQWPFRQLKWPQMDFFVENKHCIKFNFTYESTCLKFKFVNLEKSGKFDNPYWASA